MPPEFQYCNRKTKKTNLQSFSDCRPGWSKEPQWENECGSFLPCFLLVIRDANLLPIVHFQNHIKYYNKHIASSYGCHQLGVWNIPKDWTVLPKQHRCLKYHPPRLEHFAPTQLCNSQLKSCLAGSGYGFCRRPLAVCNHSSTVVSTTWIGSCPLTPNSKLLWQHYKLQQKLLHWRQSILAKIHTLC